MKETVSDGAHEVRWGVDSRGKVQRTVEWKGMAVPQQQLFYGPVTTVIVHTDLLVTRPVKKHNS